MFSFISKLIIQAKHKKKIQHAAKKFLPWDKIEKIALIVNKDVTLNKSAVDKFIEDTKKFVEVFYIETRSKEASYNDWTCFSKKDRSFLNLPKKSVEAQLKHKNYDLVINTCSASNFFSAAISATLNAPFKCAGSSHFQDADLVIRRTGSENLIAYLNDIVRYLKMIRV